MGAPLRTCQRCDWLVRFLCRRRVGTCRRPHAIATERAAPARQWLARAPSMARTELDVRLHAREPGIPAADRRLACGAGNSMNATIHPPPQEIQSMTTEQTPLTLRLLAAADCERIAEAFARQGWNKPAAQYARYFEEQEGGQREVWVAEWAGDFAGYVTVVWESDYAPFRAAAIPEIVDLNVLKRYQQQGIGSALIQRAEKRIGKRSPLAGIGVGLTA